MKTSTARFFGGSERRRSLTWRSRAAVVAALAACSLALAGCRSRGVYDPANDMPFGWVDYPVADAHVKALTMVSGWALDDRGIREIRLYIDGHLVNSCHITEARPDVNRNFPRLARPGLLSGWAMLGGFDAVGPHTV